MGYADNATIYAVIPKPLWHLQARESLNQNLAAINSWSLKWHMKLNPKKTRYMVVGQSLILASGYGDLTFGGAEFHEGKGLRILGVTLD